MKIIAAATALLSALALTGCAHSGTSFKPAHLSRVNLGMDKEEVLRVLGRPAVAGTGADGIEVFRFTERPGAQSTINHYAVVFKDGQVIDYGPEAGVRLGGHLAVPELFDSSWKQISQP
jgi:hypothetical protein